MDQNTLQCHLLFNNLKNILIKLISEHLILLACLSRTVKVHNICFITGGLLHRWRQKEEQQKGQENHEMQQEKEKQQEQQVPPSLPTAPPSVLALA